MPKNQTAEIPTTFSDPEFQPVEQIAANVPMTVIPPQPPSTLSLIQFAIEKGMGADELKGFFDLHERHEKNVAIQAYNEAMQRCQEDMPPLVCDSFNKQTSSKYISLETINRVCKPVYTRHGFSVAFDEGETKLPNHCRTTLEVAHKAGHSKHYHLDLPLDGVGIKGNANMTAIHGRLSTDTYAEVRLLKKVFNLTVAEDSTDNDGNGAGDFVADSQIEEINMLLETSDTSLKNFLEWMEVDSLAHIRSKDFIKACKGLEESRKRFAKAKAK